MGGRRRAAACAEGSSSMPAEPPPDRDLPPLLPAEAPLGGITTPFTDCRKNCRRLTVIPPPPPIRIKPLHLVQRGRVKGEPTAPA